MFLQGGMNISKAIIEGKIDAGIGLENVQQVELEEWCKANDRPATDVKMLRIDKLAELGCCCFCVSATFRSLIRKFCF